MAIKISLNVSPFGFGNDPIELGEIRIHSESATQFHFLATFKKGNGQVGHISGQIPRSKSGHRNIFHTLREVLNSPKFDTLSDNYIDVFDEIKSRYPDIERSHTADYKER